MEQEQPYTLQVIIASGPEAIGRAVLGFAFALSAVTSGEKVVIILALEAVAWAGQDIPAARQSVNGFASIKEYLDMLEDNGAVVRLCSSCAKKNGSAINCAIDRIEQQSVEAVSYVGLTEVAIRAAHDAVQTVVF
jgi:predicted peroxiredoxin